MRTLHVILVALLLLAAPLALAAPPQKASEGGLSRACTSSGNEAPCRMSRIIQTTTVGAGETRTYEDGRYEAQGTILVQAGGTVIVDNATIAFRATSDGIVVAPGGTLRVTDSTLEEASDGSGFEVDAAAGSTLTLTGSTLRGGNGLDLRTSDAQVHHNTFTLIPVAARLTDVTVTLHNSTFIDNVVSVNQTGGVTTLADNQFLGGETCVRDWLADPTIIRNVFRGCHVGIYHHRSESRFALNDMENDAYEPGVGIVVEDTMSPFIEDNVIRNYGTGILVINARAYIRNNTIEENVLDGVRIVQNSAAMDITSNLIRANGRDGIRLADVQGVEVRGNDLKENGGHGLFALGAARVVVEGNNATNNGAHGFLLQDAPSTVLGDNVAFWNTLTGFRIESSPTSALSDNHAESNGQHGFFTESDDVTFVGNLAVANAHSGFAVQAAEGAVFLGDEAHGNHIDGFSLVGATGATLNVTVAQGNARHGYRLDGGGLHVATQALAAGNAQDGYHVNASTATAVTLDFVKAFGNGRDGAHNARENGTIARNGWWEGNVRAGVANLDPDTFVDARFSYWGSANGPTVPDGNPEGGDAILGNVLYEPYRESPPGTVSVIG